MAERIIDSDVLIDALRGVRRANTTLARLVREGVVATTAVNVFELASGALTKVQLITGLLAIPLMILTLTAISD